MCTDTHKSATKHTCKPIDMIVPRARKSKVPKVHCKLDYVVLKTHLRMLFFFKKFVSIKVNKNVPQMCSQNAGKDRKGSANVTSGASVPLNLCMLMCELLNRNCLSGLPFYELGMADGILSQALSHCANMVTIGCDVDSNALLHYNSTYDKHLADET